MEKFRDEISKALFTLHKVQGTEGEGSKAEKAAILKRSDSEQLRLLLRIAYDPFLRTNVKKIEVVDSACIELVPSLVELVERVSSKKALTDSERLVVGAYVGSWLHEESTDEIPYSQLMSEILTKKLSIGVGIKSLNKVFGKNFLPAAELMKADSKQAIAEQWLEEKIETWAEVKYDGVRCFAEIRKGSVHSMKTYNMRDFDIALLTCIPAQLESLVKGVAFGADVDFFVDMEITGIDRKKVSGQVNRVLQSTAPEGIDQGWYANVFDICPMSVFHGGVNYSRYVDRRSLLETCFEDKDLQNVQISERWRVTSREELNRLFSQVLGDGEEGLILKRADGPYELKRSKAWVKMKAEIECDLEVYAVFPGEGRRAATIGGFACRSSCGGLKVDVGSGFSDKLLKEVAVEPQKYVGSVVKVRFNEVISSESKEEKSLFLPRLVEVRFDKDTANSLDEIESQMDRRK